MARREPLLNVQMDGDRAVIDVRELIISGAHPRFEIVDYVKQAPAGIVFEIHTPRYPKPLIKALEELGLVVEVEEKDKEHFLVITEKTKKS